MSHHRCIMTYVRCRPFSTDEQANWPDCLRAVVRTGPTSLLFNPRELEQQTGVRKFCTTRGRLNFDQPYNFDQVFDESISEEEIYRQVVSSRLKGVLNGINASIFAYGATGCGKTYTVSQLLNRVGKDLFSEIHASGKPTSVSVTYLQLYNDKPLDLLAGSGMRVQLRDAGVSGLREATIKSAFDLKLLLEEGQRRRVVAATRANSQSSRSHAILTLHVRGERSARFSIIDLAGSERAQGSMNAGHLVREGANINQSLLALGNCIKAREMRSAHVPYRSSKLTRLLQPTLDGSCDTAMLVCLSPSLRNFDDSKNSLEYARRCTRISAQKGASIAPAVQLPPPDVLAQQLHAAQVQLGVLKKQLTLVKEERDTYKHALESLLDAVPALRPLLTERGAGRVNREELSIFIEKDQPLMCSELSPGKRRRAWHED